MKRYLTRLMFCLLLAGTSFLSSCGPTHEERRASEEAKRIQKQSEIEKKEAELLSRLESRHGKLQVLTSMIGADAFTYELQQFFNERRDTHFLFMGLLDDIEITEAGVIAEFSSPLGKEIGLRPIVILYRLKVEDAQLKYLLEGYRAKNDHPTFRYFDEPMYTVVARIDSINRLRRYEFESRGTKEEPSSEIDVDVPLRFLARGSLLEAVKPRIKEK